KREAKGGKEMKNTLGKGKNNVLAVLLSVVAVLMLQVAVFNPVVSEASIKNDNFNNAVTPKTMSVDVSPMAKNLDPKNYKFKCFGTDRKCPGMGKVHPVGDQ